jgi:serine/threonine-protein phosphatase 2A regulatory subunit B
VHAHQLKCLSVSPDTEHFLVVDEKSISLENLEQSHVQFLIYEVEQKKTEEILNYAEFHPSRADRFIFSSSLGYAGLCDVRQSMQLQKTVVKFQPKEDSRKKNFFTELIGNMTSAKFAPCSDNYIFTRDYLSIQIWDVRNSNMPVQTFHVTDQLDQNLCEVFENEHIYDKFDLSISPCSTMALTGSYNGLVHVIDMQRKVNTSI